MVEGKLHVGTCSMSLRVEAGSMTAGYCSNCRRVYAVRRTGGDGRVVSGGRGEGLRNYK
ncbi:hypothetical protein PILCRDRAFT_821347 [Piloderma croceum F 1598]|uniref:Uncharacterized protein n=1 Tax=Piloderma croceum (strain F 1598) TaxID=765440 RepID=A0A0C3FA82_PILCF|nr:hypothetical protein PILCRDRAFT_821347 [Piloderma croceum F 1598]